MQFLKKYSPKGKAALLCLLLLLAAALWGCDAPQADSPVEDAKLPQPQITLTEADRNTGAAETVPVDLNAQEGIYRIHRAGTYLLTGQLEGCLQIDAEEQIVHLILDNVTVEAPEGPALQVLSAGKTILTLLEGTENVFRDSGYYPDDTEADACIYSESDLTINGSGTLNVHGYYKDAVHTKDVLKVLGGTLFVESKRDGLRGNDGVVIDAPELTVQSERNGLSTTKTGKPGKGNIEICSGNHSVIGGKYAISCAADLYILDSSLYLIGVEGDVKADGQRYVEEGSLLNE